MDECSLAGGARAGRVVPYDVPRAGKLSRLECRQGASRGGVVVWPARDCGGYTTGAGLGTVRTRGGASIPGSGTAFPGSGRRR